MFKKILVILVIAVLALGFGVKTSLAASWTGTLTNATAGCNFIVASAPYPGVQITGTVTDLVYAADGNGTQIGTTNYGTFTGGFFTVSGVTFSAQPAKNPISIRETLNGVQIYDLVANDPCLPAVYLGPGPSIPSGFVLRTITCTTAVFSTPGGTPVSTGEKILQGQTWFVSPTPVRDAKGKQWTEIFAGGYIDGFIWTSCVGGKPAGYAGN